MRHNQSVESQTKCCKLQQRGDSSHIRALDTINSQSQQSSGGQDGIFKVLSETAPTVAEPVQEFESTLCTSSIAPGMVVPAKKKSLLCAFSIAHGILGPARVQHMLLASGLTSSSRPKTIAGPRAHGCCFWRVESSVRPATWKHLKQQRGASSWDSGESTTRRSISAPTSRAKISAIHNTIKG